MSLSIELYYADGDRATVFDRNITANLLPMARACGLATVMWYVHENGYVYARYVTEVLAKGILELVDRPEHYKQFNPVNGWGDYDTLIRFAAAYLAAALLHPDAMIWAG